MCRQGKLPVFCLGQSPFWGSWDHTEFSTSICLVKNKLIIQGRQSRGRVECLSIFSLVMLYLYKWMATTWNCEERDGNRDIYVHVWSNSLNLNDLWLTDTVIGDGCVPIVFSYPILPENTLTSLLIMKSALYRIHRRKYLHTETGILRD